MSVLSTCIREYLLGKKIIFFGAGQYSISLMPLLYNKIAYFVDNMPSKQDKKFWGLEIFNPDKLLEEERDNTIIIVNTEHYGEIAKQCHDIGFKNIYADMYKSANEVVGESEFLAENFLKRKYRLIMNKYGEQTIAKMQELFADKESKGLFDKILELYKSGSFDFSNIYSQGMYLNDLFDFEKDEVYIDAGAYDGKTIVDFIFKVKGKYNKIYGFEPDIVNHTICKDNLSDLENVCLLNYALSNQEGELYFDNRGSQSSKISNGDKNLAKVHCVRLDSIIKEAPTFIKMDIEGAEYSALQGAAESISKYKPKLAISVYHNDDDLIEIPLLLKQLVPEYKFYLRHHTVTYVDTVLYAKI